MQSLLEVPRRVLIDCEGKAEAEAAVLTEVAGIVDRSSTERARLTLAASTAVKVFEGLSSKLGPALGACLRGALINKPGAGSRTTAVKAVGACLSLLLSIVQGPS